MNDVHGKTICPYCGSQASAGNACTACGGLLDPASRAATAQDIGPWFVRDVARPFFPGCTLERLSRMVRDGQVDRGTIIRGPTTGGFWLPAGRVPGIARMLGFCHGCEGMVATDDMGCPRCGIPLTMEHQLAAVGQPGEPAPADSALELIKHAQYRQISRLQSYVRLQAIGLAVCLGMIIVGLMLWSTGLLEGAPVPGEAGTPAAPAVAGIGTMAAPPENEPVVALATEPVEEPVIVAAPPPVPEPKVVEEPAEASTDPVAEAQRKLMEQLHAVTPEQAGLINRLGSLLEVSGMVGGPVAERLAAVDQGRALIDDALQTEQDEFMRLRLEALREIFEKDRRRIELE